MGSESLSPNDPNSFSQPENFCVNKYDIYWDVSFDSKTLSGKVVLSAERINSKCEELILDTQDLTIFSVIDESSKHPLHYEIGQNVKTFGSKMVIDLPKTLDDKINIVIQYKTSSNASGLQWLLPEQTAGKRHPYMFSQCQAIHARSLVPCQDTPSAKAKYTAEVRVPENLVAVMSAIRAENPRKENNSAIFKFVQNIPIPIYLLAIAVGRLEFRNIGKRTSVWGEKEYVDLAALEFAEAERLLEAAEDICGPYVWGVYDMLVLPPSFPFGGMENPCMTFLTPTLLAGDKSLANVVAHEMSHSWTGNLVTNSNWEHFWLNEGFTVFVERRIIQRTQGKQEEDFAAICGVMELREAVNRLGEKDPLTALVLDLRGIHPDDSFSSVPYEKGSLFLRYLESVVGGPSAFEPFLKSYLDKYKFKSINTNDFKAYFLEFFEKKANLSEIDWDTWLNTPGMPSKIPKYDDSLQKFCTRLKEKWMRCEPGLCADFRPEDFLSLSTSQKIHFLQELLQDHFTDLSKVKIMDQLYSISKIKNCEIRFRWLRICLKAHWREKIEDALQMVTEVGRMKYVRPLYQTLYEWEEARPRAIECFRRNESSMMYVTAYTVSKDLHLN